MNQLTVGGSERKGVYKYYSENKTLILLNRDKTTNSKVLVEVIKGYTNRSSEGLSKDDSLTKEYVFN
jgi:hypothetical protein